MAKTLLQAVNAVLKRVGQIQGTAEELTTFVATDRQHRVDYILQLFQLGVDGLLDEYPAAGGIAQGTLTLVQGTVTYNPETDFIRFIREEGRIQAMRDATNNRFLYPFPGGLQAMRDYKVAESGAQGQPFYFVLNESRAIELDRPPDSASAGQAFKYTYHKEVALDSITDTFPFPDMAVRALESGVAEIYKMEKKATDAASLQLLLAPAVARALRAIRG